MTMFCLTFFGYINFTFNLKNLSVGVVQSGTFKHCI